MTKSATARYSGLKAKFTSCPIEQIVRDFNALQSSGSVFYFNILDMSQVYFIIKIVNRG